MKLTQIKSHKRKSGMTLLELTVVILVLLSLISILFIGARAWKKGSDRSGCIMNIRNIQQAVRGDQNMKGREPGDTGLDPTDIVGTADSYLPNTPECPATGVAYVATAVSYPAINVLYAPCPSIATETDHVPDSIVGW